MPHPQVRERFRNDVVAAIAKFRETASMAHPGLKGRFREIFIRDLLKPILASDFIAGSGVMVDSAGGTSPEADVLIFDKFHVPAVLYSQHEGLFPLEGTYYYGEIKSRLTKHELADAIKKFRAVLAMKSLPNAQGKCWIGPRFLFAWSSDLSAETIQSELARYFEVDEAAATRPAATIICVVGKGYCYADPAEGPARWHKCGEADGVQEVVNFIGGISNSLALFRAQRFGVGFGSYIIPDGHRETLT